MKDTHFKTPRTLDECQFTYPAPIERYRPSRSFALAGWGVVVILCCVFVAAIAASGVQQ